jgi:uncharacterized protein YodC (DUF2158 family)
MMIAVSNRGTEVLCEWLDGGTKKQEWFESSSLRAYQHEDVDWDSEDHDDFMVC